MTHQQQARKGHEKKKIGRNMMRRKSVIAMRSEDLYGRKMKENVDESKLA